MSEIFNKLEIKGNKLKANLDKIIAIKPDIPNHKLSPSTIANHCTKPKAK